MKPVSALFLCVIIAITAGPVFGQNQNAAQTSGEISVEWTREAGTYTIEMSSPNKPDGDYKLLAWTLKTDGLAKGHGLAVDGWSWSANKGFELTDNSQKYVIGGSALEPGEKLTFVYVLDDPNSQPTADISFLTHVGAVNGQNAGKWIAVKTPNGPTWYDSPSVTTYTTTIPEPSSLLIIFSSFCLLACLKLKQARV